MKIKRRSIISVALVIAMIFTVGAFTSCNNEEKEQSITVNLKITSSGGEVLCNDPLMLTGAANDLTVLLATQTMCQDVLEIDFNYDSNLDSIKQIGADISELFISDDNAGEEPAENDSAGEEPAEDENPEEPAENKGEDETEVAVKDFYYDWICTLNGSEAQASDIIKDGDNIEWKWQEVKKEFVDKSRN